MRAAHNICTRVGPKHRDLRMGNWNVSSLKGKEEELVWEAKQYHLGIVGVSSTKCCGCDTVELNEGWKLFYSGVDVTMSDQAGEGIFVSPRLAHCVTDWILLGGRVFSSSLGYRSGHSAFCRGTHQTLKHSTSVS